MTPKIFMKFIFVFCILICSSLTMEDKDVLETELAISSKFKLGFEFQEVSHLCPWHSRHNSLQNKSLFTIKHKGRNLWKVVIDTFDIEFVTFPFYSDEGGQYLTICMQSISGSLEILQNLLRKKDEDLTQKEKNFMEEEQKIPPRIDKIKQEISTLEREEKIDNESIYQTDENIELLNRLIELLKGNNEAKEEKEGYVQELFGKKMERESKRRGVGEKQRKIIEYYEELDFQEEGKRKLERLLETVAKETAQVTFLEWMDGFALTGFMGDNELVVNPDFKFVEKKNIVLPKRYKDKEFWKPQFSPQITIQHPLVNTIPLYFSLFGFEANNPTAQQYILDLAKATPNLSIFKNIKSKIDIIKSKEDIEALKQNLYTPLNGLIFLHALTLVKMASTIQSSDDSALGFILSSYKEVKQIDVKMNLFLMSRRSFSEMYGDLHLEPAYSFIDDYYKKIVHGNHIFHDSRIVEEFYKVNYGEQFFDDEGNPVNLSFFSHFIEEEFYIRNIETIKTLLKEGIICTPMIRHFREEKISKLLENYFHESIRTVVEPNRRYEIVIKSLVPIFSEDENGISISQQNILSLRKDEHYKHDAFSPPWLLNREDSMGKYSRIDEAGHERDYGEAIIELRQPSHISPNFLKEYGKHDKHMSEANFLKDPETINDHALILFESLSVFQNNLNDSDFLTGILQEVISTATSCRLGR